MVFLSLGLTDALQFTGPKQINADDDDVFLGRFDWPVKISGQTAWNLMASQLLISWLAFNYVLLWPNNFLTS